MNGSERKTALITGVGGQDGSYLAEFLLGKGYDVHGLARREIATPATLHVADATDAAAMRSIIANVQPHELYHLAGQTHVGRSFEQPEQTCEQVALATLRLLEVVREHRHSARFFHASSAEIFGNPSDTPQNEDTPMRPLSPYGCAKAFATQLARVYRDAHGLFVCNGILFNHESPRRGADFVTRKIARSVARIKRGLERELVLGNLESRRDWGRAQDYVEAMWLMLQRDVADDYVVATGQTRSVREFVETAFAVVNLHWRDYVRQDPKLYRAADVTQLVGAANKIQDTLGWQARGTFEQLVREMVEAELAAIDRAAA